MLNKGKYKELRWLFFVYVFYFEMYLVKNVDFDSQNEPNSVAL